MDCSADAVSWGVCVVVVVVQSVSREVLGLVCGQRLCSGGLREVLGEEGALGIDWVDGGSTNYWYTQTKERGTHIQYTSETRGGKGGRVEGSDSVWM
jgi:hypothetical protein